MEDLDTRVGKYSIVSKIGDGGMAEVFMGRVRGEGSFEKIVAIKKILPNLTSNERFRRNFINEARICAKLHHHNIVEVYDFIQDGNDLYLVMEYIDGLTLEDMFTHHRKLEQDITTDVIFSVLFQILEGLEYAHGASDPLSKKPLNVIHRDLKPSNILIDDRGLVKIVDFGVAKAAIQRYVTQELTAKGSPSYMAPEQILDGTGVSQSADVFSVGSIFYEMLTLSRLFDGAHVFAILKQLATLDIVKHLSDTIDGGDRRYLPILRRSLARDPVERYGSAAEMLKDLRGVHAGEPKKLQLADHLREIRNLDESMEDAATRLVADPNEIMKQYFTDDDDPDAEATQYMTHAEAEQELEQTTDHHEVESDTLAETESQDNQRLMDHAPGVLRSTFPFADDPTMISDACSETTEPLEDDEPEDTATQESVRAPGGGDEHASNLIRLPSVNRAVSDELEEKRRRDAASAEGDTQPLPAASEAASSASPMPLPEIRTSSQMPSIFAGTIQPPPMSRGATNGARGPVAPSPPPTPSSQAPLQVQPFHDTQPGNIAPVLLGALIGLLILLVLLAVY